MVAKTAVLQRHHIEVSTILLSGLRLCAVLAGSRAAGEVLVACFSSRAQPPLALTSCCLLHATRRRQPSVPHCPCHCPPLGLAPGVWPLSARCGGSVFFSLPALRSSGSVYEQHLEVSRPLNTHAAPPPGSPPPQTLTAGSPYRLRRSASHGIAQGVLAVPSVLSALVAAAPSGEYMAVWEGRGCVMLW